jgi:multiple sugar transport system permease protein
LLALALLTLYPIAYTGVLAVTDEQGDYVGLGNVRGVAADRMTGVAVRNTVYFVGVSILSQIVLGTLAGILLNQTFRGRAAVRTIVLIPWIVPGLVAATTWA